MKPTSNIVNSLNRRQFAMGSLAAGAVLASGAIPAVAQSGPVKIRMGWIRVPVSFGPLFVEKKDLLKNYGKSYTVELIKFPHSPPLGAALVTDQLDVGPMNVNPLALALIGPGYGDLRIIADGVQDGHPKGGTNWFFVHKDGPIKTAADLKGAVCMSNTPGSPTEMAVRVMAKRAGLKPNDYTFIYGYNGLKMLKEKKIDLTMATISPGNFKPELAEFTRVLFTEKDGLGITQLETYCSTASFIQKNRPVLVDLLEDMMIAVRWYNDPKNHKEGQAITARLNGESTENWDWAFTDRDQYRTPDMMPNLEALKSNWQVMTEFGVMGVGSRGNAVLDPFKHADLSPVIEAAKRLPKI